MIFHAQKAIFFHVPKVAGYSIEQCILPGPRDYRKFNKDIVFGLDKGLMTQHLPYNTLQKYVDKNVLDSYFKFAFFRNTWDRLASAYFYLEPLHNSIFGNFSNCIKRVCEDVKGDYVEGWHFCRQTDYLYKNKKNGELAVDYIGRYENLEQDFKNICDRLNMPYKPLKKTNRSPKKTLHYTEYYTDETKQLVYESFKDEIEYFKYTFSNETHTR